MQDGNPEAHDEEKREHLQALRTRYRPIVACQAVASRYRFDTGSWQRPHTVTDSPYLRIVHSAPKRCASRLNR